MSRMLHNLACVVGEGQAHPLAPSHDWEGGK
jgi:hypothetical protein